MLETLAFTSSPVPIERIDRTDTLTDFSLSETPEALSASIDAIGILHPLVLHRAKGGLHVTCGHRRLEAAYRLGLKEVPARVFSPAADDETRLALNLIENSSHRTFGDVEKGRILRRLEQAGVSEESLIEKYMPFLGLERSKKYCRDFLAVGDFSPEAQSLLHALNLPLRVFSLLYRWDEDARRAAWRLLDALRPGVNKARELLTLADECALMENVSPGEILDRREIASHLADSALAPTEQYEAILRRLNGWRFPALTQVRRQVALALDGLKLDPATRVRVQDSFEGDEIHVEMKFRDREGWDRQVKKLSEASRSTALDELIRIFKSFG